MSICRSLGAVTAGILVLIAGCSDGGTTPDGGFTISIESTTLSVPQDGSGSVTVNVTRTGTFT